MDRQAFGEYNCDKLGAATDCNICGIVLKEMIKELDDFIIALVAKNGIDIKRLIFKNCLLYCLPNNVPSIVKVLLHVTEA